MQAESDVSRGNSGEIICRFCVSRVHPREGYYQMETADGEFLGNVGEEDLDHELAVLSKMGYWMGRISCRRHG